MPTHLVQHKVPAIEVPTPRRRGNATASLDGNSQQIPSHLSIPTTVQSPEQRQQPSSVESLALTPQQEIIIVRLSPTETGASHKIGSSGANAVQMRS